MAILLVAGTQVLRAGEKAWSPPLAEHLGLALPYLHMTPRDLDFDKDRAKPLWTAPAIRSLLSQPLQLPALADDVWQSLDAHSAAAVYRLAAAKVFGQELLVPEWEALPAEQLEMAIARFSQRAEAAAALQRKAFQAVPQAGRRYLAAACLAGQFNAEDHKDVRQALRQAGIAQDMVERVIDESQQVDPKPYATNHLALLQQVDYAALLQAGYILDEAVRELQAFAATWTHWPTTPTTNQTSAGMIIIGTPGNNEYAGAALLILDPAGNDVYRDGPGAANGLAGQPLAAILDLAGADVYASDSLLGAGSALWGIASVSDLAGADVYRGQFMGQGAAVMGVGVLRDQAGDDTYRARGLAQGAAYAGLGWLADSNGNDLYDVGFYGQGFAGVLGVGLLQDADGHDRYAAGGVEADVERHDSPHFISLSQGFAMGMRPFAGGGLGALVDRSGNDTYQCDIFGQGAAYWYAAGLLLDGGGNDTYTLFHYGQGTGIHLASGLLADFAGNDFYTAAILAQGSAHDFAIGMLLEHGGNDTYSGWQHAQGRAINNGLAILADSAGDDTYLARQPGECQGIGNDGGDREFGSLALLLDLQGNDVFACGATNGARLVRPDFGIVYDVEDQKENAE